jgi:hypothetical protein
VSVGDLVRFKRGVRGLEDLLGVVVELNGYGGVVVQWSSARHRPDGEHNPSCEAISLLEVISECG